MSQDDMMNQIGSFCKEAADQGTQDKDSGPIFRTYHQGGRNEVDLAIDWPPGMDIKHDIGIHCSNNMSKIMDCKGSRSFWMYTLANTFNSL